MSDVVTSMNEMLKAGEEAQQASTDAIRATSKNLVAGFAIPDLDPLRKACQTNGFNVRPAVSKSS